MNINRNENKIEDKKYFRFLLFVHKQSRDVKPRSGFGDEFQVQEKKNTSRKYFWKKTQRRISVREYHHFH